MLVTLEILIGLPNIYVCGIHPKSIKFGAKDPFLNSIKLVTLEMSANRDIS